MPRIGLVPPDPADPELAAMFAENFTQYEAHVSDDAKAAAIRA